MLSAKEQIVLKELRKNSRKKLTLIAKECNMPVSTVDGIISRLEQKINSKYVSLLDYSKLGYHLCVYYMVKAKDKQGLRSFLLQSESVNNLRALSGGFDFLAECIFKDLGKAIEFREKLEENGAGSIEEITIVDNLKNEEFLTSI